MEKYANFNIVSSFFFNPIFYIEKYIRKSPKMDFVVAIYGPP
jgi:hypothetical protein